VKEWSCALDDVVRAHLPAEWTDGKRWLTRRLNRKELRGRRFGRTWRMTDSDIAFMLGKFANITGTRTQSRRKHHRRRHRSPTVSRHAAREGSGVSSKRMPQGRESLGESESSELK